MKTTIEIILKNIAKIRKVKEIKQSEMARRLEMTQSNYAMIETGRRTLTVNVLLQIVIILDVIMEDIIYEQEKNYPITGDIITGMVKEPKTHYYSDTEKYIKSLEMNVVLLTEKLKKYEEKD